MIVDIIYATIYSSSYYSVDALIFEKTLVIHIIGYILRYILWILNLNYYSARWRYNLVFFSTKMNDFNMEKGISVS